MGEAFYYPFDAPPDFCNLFHTCFAYCYADGNTFETYLNKNASDRTQFQANVNI